MLFTLLAALAFGLLALSLLLLFLTAVTAVFSREQEPKPPPPYFTGHPLPLYHEQENRQAD